MNPQSPVFSTRVAQCADDLHAAQRLRYEVFVAELGGDGAMVDHDLRLETDRFDDHAAHLLLRDGDAVIGVYRLMTEEMAAAAGQFYCEDEYDLTPLRQSGLRLLELGRSCLHPAYRGGAAMVHLWSALADFVERERIDLLFGVASFSGTDLDRLAGPLALLQDRHLAPAHLRVTARAPGAVPMDRVAIEQVDRVAALRDTPALIKGYLRLGGVVGQGAFVDRAFNTTDVCLILPTDAISALQRGIYGRGQGLG